MAKVKRVNQDKTARADDSDLELPPDLKKIRDLYREAAKDPEFRAKLLEVLKPKVKTK